MGLEYPEIVDTFKERYGSTNPLLNNMARSMSVGDVIVTRTFRDNDRIAVTAVRCGSHGWTKFNDVESLLEEV